MMEAMAPVTDAMQPLQGRERELDLLADLLGLPAGDDDRVASAPFVLLGGDAGVGKTRLLAELVDRATDAGWRTLVGHCLDFGDSALPYLPFSEVFGRLAADDPQVASGLTQAHPALTHLQPGRRLLSGSAGPTGRDADPADTLDRSDLFESLHAALEDLVADRPLLARRGGRPLGRPVDARPALLPVHPPASAARSGSWRRTAPTTCTGATRCAPPPRSGPGSPGSTGCSSTRCPTRTCARWWPR